MHDVIHRSTNKAPPPHLPAGAGLLADRVRGAEGGAAARPVYSSGGHSGRPVITSSSSGPEPKTLIWGLSEAPVTLGSPETRTSGNQE